MGGNIFKNAMRLNSSDYHELKSEVFDLLSNIYISEIIKYEDFIREIPSYHQKQDFGDMDIILNKQFFSKQMMIDYLKDSNTPISNNGDVLSFLFTSSKGYKFQIDLVYSGPEDFLSSYHYFSWNDLGNLIGVLLKKLGVKYGHKGLSLMIREGDYVLCEMPLTKDVNIVLDIMGLDKEKFHIGFNSLLDIFEYMCSSWYFNPDVYLLENRSNISRVCDKKRKTYSEFLNYLRKNDIPAKHIFKTQDNKGGYNIKEPYYTDVVLKYFPEAEQQVRELQESYIRQKQFRKAFNPVEIGETLHLKGKELGAFYTWLRNSSDINFLPENKEEYLRSLFVSYNS